MAWTQSDIDALKAAIALGVKRVEYDGQSVTYQSREEMMATLESMEAEVAAATTGSTAKGLQATRFATKTGWH